MPIGMNRLLAVAVRVFRQLLHDRRFLGLSIIAPLLVIYITKAALDSFNVPFINASQFAVPIGAFIVHFVTYVLCAIVLVRERTAQTLARMFINGYLRSEIIGGYVAAYTCLATLQSLLVLTELSLLFHLKYSLQTLASIYVVIWLLAVISILLGIFVSNFARNEGQVFPFIPLVTVPGIFLSDVIFSVDHFPKWMQWLSHATPLFYANKVIQGLIQGGKLGDHWQRMLGLVLYGSAILVLATRTLRERD
jgi:ABC-2 type transport system permease protein